MTNSIPPNSLRAELDSPQITISSDYTNSNKAPMIKYMILEELIYLDDDGNIRPKPTWNTIIAVFEE